MFRSHAPRATWRPPRTCLDYVFHALPPRSPRNHQTDVLIVGAGPVGLFAAFQAGVLGLKCELIDVLDRAGGQCTELYPEKPIYDIPAVPGCLAQDLVDRLMEQCAPSPAFSMHFSQRADSVSEGTPAPTAIRACW